MNTHRAPPFRFGDARACSYTEFPMNSRALFYNFVHFHLPPPVHGASGNREPARRLSKTLRAIPSYLLYDKIARVL